MSEIIYILLNALWITGLSIILAVVGIGSYFAGENKKATSKIPGTRKSLLPIYAGAFLICTGVAGLAGTVGEKILWLCLGISVIAAAVWDSFQQFRNKNRTNTD